MKIFTGRVVSKKMQDTAVVEVSRVVTHPIYQKRIKRTKKYHVHDEIGVEVGKTVKFVGSKPYSKTKKWKITEIVEDKSKKVNSTKKVSNTPKKVI
jgi:small subunit ribosomal protein S17